MRAKARSTIGAKDEKERDGRALWGNVRLRPSLSSRYRGDQIPDISSACSGGGARWHGLFVARLRVRVNS
jgi:hypothetical protein